VRFDAAPRFLFVPAALALTTAALAAQPGPAPSSVEDRPAPADLLRASLEPPLAAVVDEVLERNPELARLRATATALAARAPQMRSWPDPMASLTAFPMSPETRVGPQQAQAAISQRFPWFGKLELRERRALLEAEAALQAVEAKRLALVTETRRLAWELAFLDEQERVLAEDRATLAHYEELARARYASGVGREQAVIKLQAEITRDDNRLLEIASRRAALASALDALRDRPGGGTPAVPSLATAPPHLPQLDPDALRATALDCRPEVTRARSLAAASEMATELAKKEYRPDWTLGLGYTLVGARRDAVGRAMPPQGNGDDILGVTLGVGLPVHRERLAAGVAEAEAGATAAREELRATVAGIEQSLGELAARLPLLDEQLALFDGLLSTQAEEALRSAESAYSSGTADALDLLDAERVLLEVRIGAARLRADALVARARLEGALGAPLATLSSGEAR